MVRVRFVYRRDEALKFLSHLDVLRTLHRAFRRAGYPLLYRGKFNPQPRLDPGIPLPLGVTSECEYGEVFLGPVDVEKFTESINRQLPFALQVKQAALVSLEEAALMEQVNSALYRVFWRNERDVSSNQLQEEHVVNALEGMKNFSELVVFRKGKKKKKNKGAPVEKKINIRPYLFRLQSTVLPSGIMVEMLLQTGNRGGTSPAEVIGKMKDCAEKDLWDAPESIHRAGLFWYDGNKTISPPPFSIQEEIASNL